MSSRALLLPVALWMAGCPSGPTLPEPATATGPTLPEPAAAAGPTLPAEPWGLPFEVVFSAAETVAAAHRGGDVVAEVQAVQGLANDAAARIAEDRGRVFASLFEVRRTDYPGQQTTFVDCPAEFRPTRERRDLPGGGWVDAWTSFANQARVAGACAEDIAVHRSVLAHVFCPRGGTLLRVTWSVPVGEGEAAPQAFVAGLNCDGL